MRYLKGIVDYGLNYTRDRDFRLYGYRYSDWVGGISDIKSTLGGIFSSGLSMISWISRKQSNVSISTVEEECIIACFSSCESIWIQKLFSNLFDLEIDATMILCDNQNCMKMTDNPVFHDKMKHIEIWYFYSCDMLLKEAIKLQYVSIYEQVADVLTKPLSRVKFEHL